MNAIASPANVVLEIHSNSMGSDSDRGCFTLRRTGQKALRFQGQQLVDAAGLRDGREVWHDLNIYGTDDQQIVVELITRRSMADQQDLYEVETFNNLTDAATWLQAYDSASHAPIPSGLGAADMSLPWAVMQAVHLRQTMDRICIDYKSLLTEVFMALDLTDPIETHLSSASGNASV